MNSLKFFKALDFSKLGFERQTDSHEWVDRKHRVFLQVYQTKMPEEYHKDLVTSVFVNGLPAIVVTRDHDSDNWETRVHSTEWLADRDVERIIEVVKRAVV